MSRSNASQSTEEQERYVIDEGNHKETKILSEEQAKILQKLVKANHAVISDEERDLIYKLLDKLDQETARVKNLKQVTIGDKPLDELLNQSLQQKAKKKASATEARGEDDDGGLPELPTHRHIIGFKPEEVVKQYIECWNQQKFGAEYDCFSPDFLRTDRDTYKEARQKFYQSQLGMGGMKIHLNAVETSHVTGAEADVTASKTIAVGNQKPYQEKDKYLLKLNHGKWVIYGVQPIERKQN